MHFALAAWKLWALAGVAVHCNTDSLRTGTAEVSTKNAFYAHEMRRFSSRHERCRCLGLLHAIVPLLKPGTTSNPGGFPSHPTTM